MFPMTLSEPELAEPPSPTKCARRSVFESCWVLLQLVMLGCWPRSSASLSLRLVTHPSSKATENIVLSLNPS